MQIVFSSFFVLLVGATSVFANDNEITLDEARAFLKVHLPLAFPGSEVTNEHLIKTDTFNTQKIVCYGVECWPVRKERREIVDLATESAKSLASVRVEFRGIDSTRTTSKKGYLKGKVFALELNKVSYIANILRFLDGYSFYAGYSIKFIERNSASNLPEYDWAPFQYFKDGKWHKNAPDVLGSFENIGHLEEIYDGDLALLGQSSADQLPTSGYWHGKFAEISPWAQTIDAIIKNGREVANLSADANILPEGPRLHKKTWIYP